MYVYMQMGVIGRRFVYINAQDDSKDPRLLCWFAALFVTKCYIIFDRLFVCTRNLNPSSHRVFIYGCFPLHSRERML